MTRDPFTRWMQLAFPWIEPEGTEWPRLQQSWKAGRNGKSLPIGADKNATAAWKAGRDSAT